jgi:hypothetical protein
LWKPQGKNPAGELVGCCFADVIGQHIVPATHKFNLERSPTYSAAYRELLKILDQRYGKNVESSDPIEKQAAMDVKAELPAKVLEIIWENTNATETKVN